MDVMELIWIASAFLSGLLVSRLALPPMVGYLIAGYLLHAFNIAPLQSLGHLAEVGIQLLLFSVGLKLKARTLLRREVLTVGGLHLLLMAIVSALVFFWLNQHITGGLVLGISLAFSSTVFAIKALEDNGELSSLHGRDVLSILILQDVVAIGLLAWTEGKQATPWALSILALPLLRPLAHRLLSACRSSEL
jgi:predicted Kef-type K+ transport protein